MTTLTQKWHYRITQVVFYPIFFILFGIISIIMFLGVSNGRILGYSESRFHQPLPKVIHKPSVQIKPMVEPTQLIQLYTKGKSIPFAILNRTKASTSLPIWERPLPQEPIIPQLNIRTLPIPEVTSGLLIIPSLGLEEPITRVLVKNGRWDVSELNAQIGHLQTTGEHPGDGLAMTFVGHTSWLGAGPFAKLNQLNHGEQVIYRWNGSDYIYQIDQMTHVQPTQVSTLYEENGDAIVLATCSGWNASASQYDTRLVTRAVLIEKRPAPSPARLKVAS